MPERTCRIEGEDIKMGGGGGSYYTLTPQGIVAAGIAHNPDYGKLAADSIAKEIEERKLIPAAATTEEIASGEEHVSPAAGTDEITAGAGRGAGIRE
jgi:hypothetical protein